MKKLPFVSIIVCTHNGEKCIKDCLNALIKQDYPKDNCEIIVVDDGSTDNTREVVLKYPVRLFSHVKNRGTYTARNTGLYKSRGEIVIYTDDDCIPNKEWVKNLVEPYKDKSIVAVGGITKSFSDKSITERYMAEIRYGNPAPIMMGKSKNPIYRFSYYLKDMLFSEIKREKNIIDVFAIYTLNASYRKKILKDVGGWDESFKYGGDTEISARIHSKLKDKRIVFNPKAIVIHKHRVLFIKFMKEIYNRANSRVKYYKKYTIFPPIYPFPIFAIILSAFSIIVMNYYSLFVIPFIPLILYFWYPKKFLKTGDSSFLAFAYMQLIHESVTTIGMLRTYIKLK